MPTPKKAASKGKTKARDAPMAGDAKAKDARAAPAAAKGKGGKTKGC